MLVAAPVSDAARLSMPQPLWSKLVTDWIGATQFVAYSNGVPVLADCKSAGADFMVVAPFDLRPRLPGMPNSSGRVAARTNIAITNCLTNSVVYNQTINLDSEPISDAAAAGDTATTLWAKDVPAALAQYPVFFARIARIISVHAPTALVDLRGAKPGDVFRVYAGQFGKAKPPIYLVVRRQIGKDAEMTFSTQPGAIVPVAGDFVEPVAREPVTRLPAPQ